MTPRYRNWTVSGYLRPVIEWTSEGERFDSGAREVVVAVFEPDGCSWHVTVDTSGDAPRLTSLTMQGQPITAAMLRQVPLGYLTDVAAGYLRDVAENVDTAPGAPLWQALAVSDQEAGEVRLSGQPPTPQAFAAEWQHTPARSQVSSGVWLPRREALAHRYSVTVYTIDKWTRAARDAGLIGRSKVGRRRNPQTPGGKGHRANQERRERTSE